MKAFFYIATFTTAQYRYSVADTKGSWAYANRFCLVKGGSLAIISDLPTYTLVKRAVRQFEYEKMRVKRYKYFVGLSKNREGVWEWSDNT